MSVRNPWVWPEWKYLYTHTHTPVYHVYRGFQSMGVPPNHPFAHFKQTSSWGSPMDRNPNFFTPFQRPAASSSKGSRSSLLHGETKVLLLWSQKNGWPRGSIWCFYMFLPHHFCRFPAALYLVWLRLSWSNQVRMISITKHCHDFASKNEILTQPTKTG